MDAPSDKRPLLVEGRRPRAARRGIRKLFLDHQHGRPCRYGLRPVALVLGMSTRVSIQPTRRKSQFIHVASLAATKNMELAPIRIQLYFPLDV